MIDRSFLKMGFKGINLQQRKSPRTLYVSEMLNNSYFKVFLSFSRLRDFLRDLPPFVRLFLFPQKFYPELKPVLEDAAIPLNDFIDMIESLTLLTDGEKLYSLSDSPNLQAVDAPIELSKVFYETFEVLTIVHKPLPNYSPLESRLSNNHVPSEANFIDKIVTKNTSRLFKEIVAKHYGQQPVNTREFIENNEDFITSLLRKYDLLCTNVCIGDFENKQIYRVRFPNIFFPTKLLNPQNPLHHEALVLHTMEDEPELLAMYYHGTELEESEFKRIMNHLKYFHPQLLPHMPFEIQVAALNSL